MNQSFDNDRQPDPPPAPDAGRRGLFSVGALVLLLSACGGGSDYSSPPPPPAPPPPAPPPPAASCGATAISANHGHTLVVPAADLDSMVNVTYTITGSADHPHVVVLTPAQLQQIRAQTAIVVNSSTEVGHFHEVTVNCT